MWVGSCLCPWRSSFTDHPWAACTSGHLPHSEIWPPSYALLRLPWLLQYVHNYLPRERLCWHLPELHFSPPGGAPISARQFPPHTFPLCQLRPQIPSFSHRCSGPLDYRVASHVFLTASLHMCLGAWCCIHNRCRGSVGETPQRIGWLGIGNIYSPLPTWSLIWVCTSWMQWCILLRWPDVGSSSIYWPLSNLLATSSILLV